MRSLRLAVAACAIAVLAAACGGGSATPRAAVTASASPSTYTSPPPVLPGPGSAITLSSGPAPWAPPAIVNGGAQSAVYVNAAGFTYSQEMLTVHYHAHLDVIVDGKPVEVPPYLGFVARGQQAIGLAPLHTHDASGIIHIENSVPATFVLGQFFIEWGVRLTPTCVGGYCADNGKQIAFYVNGQRFNGDPNTIVLTRHEEIAIVYGDSGRLPKPPASFTFPNGL